MKNQSIEKSKLPIPKCVYILRRTLWRTEDVKEDVMEDGRRLRRTLWRTEDVDLILI